MIERDPDKRPVVEGTKIGVLQIHRLVVRDGIDPEQVVEAFEHRITVEEIDAALNYYYEHEDEMQRFDAEDEWRGQAAPHRYPYRAREKTGDDSDPELGEVIERMLERARETPATDHVDEEVWELVNEYGEEEVKECARIILEGEGTFRMAGRDVFGSTYEGVVVGTSLTECLRRMRDS